MEMTGSYFVRMKPTTPRKLLEMLPGLRDPYKMQKYACLLDFGVQGFGNIYIYISLYGVGGMGGALLIT